MATNLKAHSSGTAQPKGTLRWRLRGVNISIAFCPFDWAMKAFFTGHSGPGFWICVGLVKLMGNWITPKPGERSTLKDD